MTPSGDSYTDEGQTYRCPACGLEIQNLIAPFACMGGEEGRPRHGMTVAVPVSELDRSDSDA